MFEPWTNPSLSLEKGVTLSVWRDNFSYFQFVQTVALFLSSSLHNLATEIKLVSVLIENPNFTVANYLQVLLWMHLMAKKKKNGLNLLCLRRKLFPLLLLLLTLISKRCTANQLKTDQAFPQLFSYQAHYLWYANKRGQDTLKPTLINKDWIFLNDWVKPMCV